MRGRPSSYTEEIAERICSGLENGIGLQRLTRSDPTLPSESMVYRWLDKYADFREKYARARERQADLYVEQIIDIVDNSDDANMARVRMDGRKWVSSKLAPKKYGDKTVITGADGKDLIPDRALVDARIAVLLVKAGLSEADARAAIEAASSDDFGGNGTQTGH